MDRLQDIRRKLGLSQAELAAKLDLHQSTISRFETGEMPLDRRTLLAAKALMGGQGA